MAISFTLLVLAASSCIAWFLGRGRGLAALVGLLLVAAIVSCSQSSDIAMVIGYGLAFGWPALLGSIALGAFAGALFARRRFLLAPILFLPLLYYAATSEKSERNEAHEEVAAKEFATNHPALIGLLGGASEVTLAARTKYADGSKSKYEFSLNAGNPVWAIVTVDRGQGTAKFQLECVTTVYMGHRNTKKKACEQGVVPLDGSTAVFVEHVPARDAKDAGAIPTASAPPAVRSFLPSFSPETQAHGIGIYESGTAIPASAGRRGRVMVEIGYSTKPLVLVLSSHESVQWVLNTNSREIAAVLLSGNPKSSVAGYLGGAVYIGNRQAHEPQGLDVVVLKDLVFRTAKLRMQFQGAHTGAAFAVPSN